MTNDCLNAARIRLGSNNPARRLAFRDSADVRTGDGVAEGGSCNVGVE
jgi:hypothetical protein